MQTRRLGKILFGTLVLVLFFAWPTLLYREEGEIVWQGMGHCPLRVNRLTGTREIELPDAGWYRLGPGDQLENTFLP